MPQIPRIRPPSSLNHNTPITSAGSQGGTHTLSSTTKTPSPGKLKDRNLICNKDKTEEYVINKTGDSTWKKCKYLGSLIDTEADYNRRKILALEVERKLKNIWRNT